MKTLKFICGAAAIFDFVMFAVVHFGPEPSVEKTAFWGIMAVFMMIQFYGIEE